LHIIFHTENYLYFCVKIKNVKLTKTIVLKLAEHDESLDKTLRAYSEGLNFVSKVVYENGKTISANNLQRICYPILRNKIGLKAQMTCNVCRQVAGAYKSMKSNGEWKLAKFDARTMVLSYGRDFSFKGEYLSITTLDGRKKYKLIIYDYAKQYFDGTWKFLASRLVKRGNEYYFHLGVEKEVPDVDLSEAKKFMGVDIGLNYIAVASTTDLECRFFDGGIIKHIRHMFVNMRRRLQKKGTRSAKRVLKRIAGREKRLINNICHTVSKRIVEFAVEKRVDVIGLENLNGIRKRAKVRKKQRYDFESWVYRKLQFMIEYKAKERGILVVYINPKHTSITCPRCHHVNKANRSGKLFRCKACGYTLNADLVGARNIEKLVSSAICGTHWGAVSHPDASPRGKPVH